MQEFDRNKPKLVGNFDLEVALMALSVTRSRSDMGELSGCWQALILPARSFVAMPILSTWNRRTPCDRWGPWGCRRLWHRRKPWDRRKHGIGGAHEVAASSPPPMGVPQPKGSPHVMASTIEPMGPPQPRKPPEPVAAHGTATTQRIASTHEVDGRNRNTRCRRNPWDRHNL